MLSLKKHSPPKNNHFCKKRRKRLSILFLFFISCFNHSSKNSSFHTGIFNDPSQGWHRYFMCAAHCLAGWILKKLLVLHESIDLTSKDHSFNSHCDHCLWWFSSAVVFVMCQLVCPLQLGIFFTFGSGWTWTNNIIVVHLVVHLK